MYKLIVISIIITVFSTGCSVLRTRNVNDNVAVHNMNNASVMKGVHDNNISGNGYFVKKADVEVFSQGQRENVVATVKYSPGGEYLVSVRTKTGIEAARVFIGKDTLMINDRMNKVLYIGKPDYIRRKFSIPADILPVIFGDFIKLEKVENEDSICIDGKLKYITISKDIKVMSVIDCNTNKTVSTVVQMDKGRGNISMKYSNFKSYGSVLYPGTIKLSGLPEQLELQIDIKSIEIPWIGDLDFIPGNKYEKVELK
jgi:hypothetical protein